jgi:hypothetical protein
MLEQYAATFAANEIDGPILLDVSLEGRQYFLRIGFSFYHLSVVWNCV